MAKRELECGHKPLRPSERLFAYVGFIIMIGLTFEQAHSEGLSLRLMIYTLALLIAVPCAFIAFWDARVTVRLRRREYKQRQAAHRQPTEVVIEVPESKFSNAQGSWDFFGDPAPTTR